MEIDFPPSRRYAQDDPWVVFDYEVEMYFETQKAALWVNKRLEEESVQREMLTLRNNVAESMVLHTRILIDILISKKIGDDDIGLSDLLPDWCQTANANQLINNLKHADGTTKQPNSPCCIINKMLAHPTSQRSNMYDWGLVINKVSKEIFEILVELRKITNRFVLVQYFGGA
jgi:hypothetical protein